MKKQLSKKLLWQSILSVLAMGILILLAVGSSSSDWNSLPELRYEYGKGWIETATLTHGRVKTTTGERDIYGNWDGPIKIESSDVNHQKFTIEVNMVHGKRHGICKTTIFDGIEVFHCYNMDNVVDCEKKAAHTRTADITAFQVLNDKYPVFLLTLNAFGFEDEYVEAYMDTVETVLVTYEFEEIDFDSCYDDVISVLEETPYDSIISANLLLSFFNGLDLIKNSELRMAVIDRYRSDGNTTYSIVETTYPGYILSLELGDVSDQDFEAFCKDLDSCMTSYGTLDPEDLFFIDSVDMWLYRAITSIMETEDSKSTEMLKSAAQVYVNEDLQVLWHEINSMLNQYSASLTPAEVSEVVLYFIFMQFFQGDIVKRAVREAYFINNGVVSFPTVTTEFSGNNSATSVTLNGYVLEDGGAAVSSRGIAWATFYNPTTDDHTETSGTGTGSFAITLDGLTEGETYYARTYAINSAGTAYGNCISFIAQTTVGIEENKTIAQDLNVYPNPASALTTFSFQVESSEIMVLTIVNLKGQVAYHHDLGSLPQGKNQIEVDLSDIPGGIYNCQLTNNGTLKVTRKLVIVH